MSAILLLVLIVVLVRGGLKIAGVGLPLIDNPIGVARPGSGDV